MVKGALTSDDPEVAHSWMNKLSFLYILRFYNNSKTWRTDGPTDRYDVTTSRWTKYILSALLSGLKYWVIQMIISKWLTATAINLTVWTILPSMSRHISKSLNRCSQLILIQIQGRVRFATQFHGSTPKTLRLVSWPKICFNFKPVL